MEENKNIQTSNVGSIKKRTFTESEQNTGSYNVGLKKNTKPNISQKQKQQVLKHLKDINPDIKLENMEQEQLLTTNSSGDTIFHTTMKIKYCPECGRKIGGE